jgi:hypothetical protein
VNTRKLGSLDVAKIVNWNGVPVDNQAAFELCITGPSYPNGNCKPIGFGGGALLWTNLIPGEYAVDETDPGSAWSVTIGGSPATVPADGGEAKADVTNTRKLGSLQVTKTVQWNGITPDGSQSFTLCITGPSYPDGDCQAAGPNGGVLTWSRLIPGEYVVTEADPGDPWTATITGSPARVPLNGGQAEAGITNSRKLGSLQVNKTVLWNGVTPDEDKQFEICIAGPSYPTGDCRNADYDGGVLTWTDLIPGQYSVVETNPGGEWTVQGNGAQVLVPANGGQAAASISNSRKLGSLQVTKTANWNGVAPDAAKQFQICISGPSYPAGNCQAAPSTGAILTWANLIPGSYTVAETNPGEEWQIAVAGSPAAVPADGGQAVAEIANSRKLGSLQVTKTVEWNGLDPDETMTFEICITGPSHPAGDCQVAGHHGAVLTWVDLIPGEYLVAETDPGAAWSVAVIGDTAAVPTDGGQAAASITNTRRHGSLTVTKIVNWNGVPVDESQGFEICIKGPSFPDGDCQTVGHRGGALTWSSLLPGEYVVGEADPGPAWSVILPQAPALVPADGTGAAVEVVNSRKLGSLRVTKVADWQGIPPNPAQTFQVCITGPSFPDGDCRKVGAGGGSLDWTGLIPGPYRVTETDPGSEWTVAGVPADVTLAEDGTQGAVTVTNTRKLGSLQVTKLVNWNGIVAGEAQTFTVCIQGPSYPAGSCQVAGPNGGVLGWQNLVPGEYAISEVDPGKQWFATYSSATVTVPADGTPASATITNTRRRGSLTISKVVNWNGIPVDTNESFEICITGPSFESADCGTVGPNGGALNWGDLLPGVYTVAETNPGAQWSVVISPTQVTVSEDGDNVTASIVNTRRLGVLEVLKVVDWGAAPADNQKVFTICVNGPSFPAGSCKTIGFGGGALTWSGLLPGVYTVTETDPGRAWTVQVAESPVTVPLSGGRVQVTITNTKLPPARITVTKVVSQTTEQQWSFVVRLNGANPKTLTKAQPTAIWENLEPNQSYILSEDDPPVPWTEGAFVCAAAGASTGEEVAEHDMQVTAAANADIACTKYNDEISGTDEEPVDEPGSGYDLFLPAVQR